MAGCCAAPAHYDPPSHAPTYAEGWREGQAYERRQLRDDPAFHVSRYVLSACHRQASWLPRSGKIRQQIWWNSRGRNLTTLDACADNANAKRAAIIRMLDAVRNDDE